MNKSSKQKSVPKGSKLLLYKKWYFWVIIVFSVFGLASMYSSGQQSGNLKFGTVLEQNEVCGEYDENYNCVFNRVVLKVRVSGNTVDENYYNVVDFVKNHGGDRFDEIQYWAVAKARNGDDVKVISFTLPESLIRKVMNNEVLPNQFGDYVADLFVSSSLGESSNIEPVGKTDSLEFLRKCTIMEAADIYNSGIGGDRNNAFEDARETCRVWEREWSDFDEVVEADWQARKDELVESEPLTYYLEILGW